LQHRFDHQTDLLEKLVKATPRASPPQPPPAVGGDGMTVVRLPPRVFPSASSDFDFIIPDGKSKSGRHIMAKPKPMAGKTQQEGEKVPTTIKEESEKEREEKVKEEKKAPPPVLHEDLIAPAPAPAAPAANKEEALPPTPSFEAAAKEETPPAPHHEDHDMVSHRSKESGLEDVLDLIRQSEQADNKDKEKASESSWDDSPAAAVREPQTKKETQEETQAPPPKPKPFEPPPPVSQTHDEKAPSHKDDIDLDDDERPDVFMSMRKDDIPSPTIPKAAEPKAKTKASPAAAAAEEDDDSDIDMPIDDLYTPPAPAPAPKREPLPPLGGRPAGTLPPLTGAGARPKGGEAEARETRDFLKSLYDNDKKDDYGDDTDEDEDDTWGVSEGK